MMSQNFLKRRIEEIKATAVSVGIDLQPEAQKISCSMMISEQTDLGK